MRLEGAMTRRPLIVVGIPVWRGGAFVHETIESVLRQVAIPFSLLISVDGADMDSVAACRPFLKDSRVRMVVQKSRLGWVRNMAFLMSEAVAQDADYACVQPHDDLMEDDYLAELVAKAEAYPAAAVVYSDLRFFGAIEDVVFSLPSVIGLPLERVRTLLREPGWVAFRGLTRTAAIRALPAMSGNPFDDFSADHVWVMRLARIGDLVRVPRVLYRKRYHDANTSTKWFTWSLAKRSDAWTHHCLDLLAEALYTAGTSEEQETLWKAARELLLMPPWNDFATMRLDKRMLRRLRLIWRFEAAAQRKDVGLAHADLPPESISQLHWGPHKARSRTLSLALQDWLVIFNQKLKRKLNRAAQ